MVRRNMAINPLLTLPAALRGDEITSQDIGKLIGTLH